MPEELLRRYNWSWNRLSDGQWYWHLYFDGERCNGGLVNSESECKQAVRNYRAQHSKGQLVQQYVWDEETQQWISMKDLGLL